MPEGITAEKLLNNLMETISDNAQKKKSVSFFEEEKSNSVSSQIRRLFGREKPIHHLLGGGKCMIILFVSYIMSILNQLKFSFLLESSAADVMLWRNKKISASFIAGATIIWVLFEWLNYHFLTLLCFSVVLGMILQFIWSNASVIFSRCSCTLVLLVLLVAYTSAET